MERQEITRAAHLFDCYDAAGAIEHCEAEGIAEEDWRAGWRLAEQRKAARQAERRDTGHPMYGGGNWR